MDQQCHVNEIFHLLFEEAGIVVDHREHDYHFVLAMFEKFRPEMVHKLALMLMAWIV